MSLQYFKIETPLQGRRRRCGRSGERRTTFLADHGIRRTTFVDRRSSAYLSLFFLSSYLERVAAY